MSRTAKSTPMTMPTTAPLLKVRTVTVGITLQRGEPFEVWRAALESAASFCAAASKLLLAAGFEVLEAIEGPNDGVGGVSTGFVHLKVCAGEHDGGGELEARAHVEAEGEAQGDHDAFLAMEAALLGDLQRSLQSHDNERGGAGWQDGQR